MSEVGELSCPSTKDDDCYSEASSAFMTEENWHFEEDHGVMTKDDCSNTTITNEDDEEYYFGVTTSSLPRLKNNYFLQRDSVQIEMMASQKDQQQPITKREEQDKLTTEETCSTPKTEEEEEDGDEGCYSISIASQHDDGSLPVGGHHQQPKEYEDCLSRPPVVPEQYHHQDNAGEEQAPRTSLDSQVLLAKTTSKDDSTIDGCGDTTHSEDTIKTKTSSVVGDKINNSARYSKAAQVLLQRHNRQSGNDVDDDDDDSPSKELLLESLKREKEQEQVHKDDIPVKEHVGNNNTTTNACDDVILGLCNGLADGTLYACHLLMVCMCESPPPQPSGQDDDTQSESTEIIIIPEEQPAEPRPLMVEPIVVPQIVRKGHVLPQIIKTDDNDGTNTTNSNDVDGEQEGKKSPPLPRSSLLRYQQHLQEKRQSASSPLQ